MGADTIIPGLIVGDLEFAKSQELLRSSGITHIIVAAAGLLEEVPAVWHRLELDLLDEEVEDLISELPEAIGFAAEAWRGGGVVLIHCLNGVSRSAAVAAACLMQYHSMRAEDALELLKRRRPSICPNCGFKRQLELFEQMALERDGATRAHLLYRRIRDVRSVERTGSVATDTLQSPVRSVGDQRIYRCRRCGRVLFTGANCIVSYAGVVYVEPMSWMQNQLERSEKRVVCACGAKLGSHDAGVPAEARTPDLAVVRNLNMAPIARVTESRVDVLAARRRERLWQSTQ